MAEVVAYEAYRNRVDVLKEVRIADISFAFKNNKLIKGLIERGNFIIGQKWKKFHKIEKLLQEKIKDTGKLTTPTAAFVTFEEEDAVHFALKEKGDTKAFAN